MGIQNRAVAMDIAPRMIEAARANAERDGLAVTFRVQSVTALNEPPGSFDTAYWAGSYQHVPGRALRVATLRRVARALTPDGVLILMMVYRRPRGLLSRSRLVDLLRALGAKVGFAGAPEVRAESEAAGFDAREETLGGWVCRQALLDSSAGFA